MHRPLRLQYAAAVWTWPRRLIWLGLLVLAVFVHGSFFLHAMSRPGENLADFFQEWASARNLSTGLPIYAPQRETVRRYLKTDATPDAFFIEINAHPPTAVLLALPFAQLNYPPAFLAWNWLSLCAVVASVWMIVREAGLRFSGWALLPAITLLLGNPFMQHFAHGQLGAVLLLLITGVWVADRRGHDVTAGALLATATAIKLFPGFLFLYFVFKGKWRPVAAGAAAFVVISALTAAVLGPAAFEGYVNSALPEATKYRIAWCNWSPQGFLLRLFDAEAQGATPIVDRPRLAQAGYVFTVALVLIGLWTTTRRSRSRATGDLCFSLFLPAMLLVSPITWDHYFVLLAPTVLLVGARTVHPGSLRGLFRLSLGVLWLNPYVVCSFFLGRHWSPITTTLPQNLLLVSQWVYALLVLFAVALVVTRRAIDDATSETLDAELQAESPQEVTHTTQGRRLFPAEAL